MKHAILSSPLLSVAMTAQAQAPGKPTPIGIDSDVTTLDISGTWN